MRRLILWYILSLMLGVAPAAAATYYLSPTGQDSGAGTSTSAPWRTFAYALPRLQPGDTLLLLDGVYTLQDSGMLQVQCSAVTRGFRQTEWRGFDLPLLPRGRSAERAAPITVQAQHSRLAHVKSDGSKMALRLLGCSNWVISGLYFSSADNTTGQASDGSVGVIEGSSNVIVRDNIFAFTNRYFNSHLLSVNYKNSDMLIEGNEFYSTNRHGILLYADGPNNMPQRMTVRRNYLNSRNYGSIPGGWTVGTVPDRGATGISCYPCKESLFENNIVENFDSGYDMQCKFDCTNNRYRGNINLHTAFSVGANARREVLGTTDPRIMPTNTTYIDHVSLGADRPNSILGIFRANKNAQFTNCSFLDSVNQLFFADHNGEDVGDNQPSLYGTNLLARNAPTSGWVISQTAWGLDHVMQYSIGASSPPVGDSHYTNVQDKDPVLGTCLLWIPAGSPAKGAGAGGADIGANVLYRYQDGSLTTHPLWDTVTGQFPCGAVVPGVGDVAGSSCRDVHQRLHVGTEGCPLPSGAGSGVVVAWKAPTDGGTPEQYGVWRQDGSAPFALVSSVPATVTTYTDAHTTAEACYYVEATNAHGGTATAPACVQAQGEPPGAPQDLTVTPQGGRR